jgi:hypothetical protein
MFYCNDCAIDNKWPYGYGMPMSRGPCEICGKTRDCVDVPSGQLPMPKEQPNGSDDIS